MAGRLSPPAAGPRPLSRASGRQPPRERALRDRDRERHAAAARRQRRGRGRRRAEIGHRQVSGNGRGWTVYRSAGCAKARLTSGQPIDGGQAGVAQRDSHGAGTPEQPRQAVGDRLHRKDRLGPPARIALEQDRCAGVGDRPALGLAPRRAPAHRRTQVHTLAGQRMHAVRGVADQREPMRDGASAASQQATAESPAGGVIDGTLAERVVRPRRPPAPRARRGERAGALPPARPGPTTRSRCGGRQRQPGEHAAVGRGTTGARGRDAARSHAKLATTAVWPYGARSATMPAASRTHERDAVGANDEPRRPATRAHRRAERQRAVVGGHVKPTNGAAADDVDAGLERSGSSAARSARSSTIHASARSPRS